MALIAQATTTNSTDDEFEAMMWKITFLSAAFAVGMGLVILWMTGVGRYGRY